MSSESELYSWAFRAGKTMFECLSASSGGREDTVRNKLRSFVLSLRSELTPERFRRALVDQIVSIMVDCDKELSLPRVIKMERPWTVDEFYRYSTAILAGLYEAIFSRYEGV